MREMRKTGKFLAVVFSFAIFAMALAGCGRKELDAAKAVDAYLRAELKGEFDDYAEMVGEDKEKLQEEYDRKISETMEMFEEIDFFGASFGDDFAQEVKNLLASAKYEVIGSQKDDDGNYAVDVEVSPSNVFSLFFGKAMDEVKSIEDEEQIGNIILQALRDAIAEQTYGDPESYQVHITYDEEDKQYEISEEDVGELSSHFFDIEGALGQVLTSSGTVYDNPYFNWSAEEWNAASDDEKTQCCLELIQEVYAYSDEDMAQIDLSDPSILAAIDQIKEGINIAYSSGAQMSIGDYAGILAEELE